jgi:YVTN family beta-propeller protein
MVWVTNPDEDTVSRIDPATNTVTGTFSSGGSLPIGIASTPGAVWVSNHHADDSGRGSVVRLDPSSGAVVATITLGAETFAGGPGGMTVAAGSVWVSVPNLGAVARIDPASNEVSSLIPMDGPCGIPASVGAYVVVPSFGCGRTSLARIDASSNTLGKLNPGGISRFAAGASGSMWVTVTSASCPPKCPPSTTALSRVDPLTGVVISRLPLEGFGFVAAGADSIWVGVGATGEVLRIQP